MNKRRLLPWLPGGLLPALLIALFYTLRGDQELMTFWVRQVLAPFIQTVGQFWAGFPFSVGEVLTTLFLAGAAVWLLRAVVLLFREKRLLPLLRRVTAFGCVLLWLWAGLCWMWNCTYQLPSFAQEHALSKAPYSPQQLIQVTMFFAYQTAALSTQMPRDEEGALAITDRECFQRGLEVYEELGTMFPGLELSPRQAKPLVFSRLQSYLGYTGVYFPFTGEANVNVDQVTPLVPATIAHEMAHQRLVASEDECNFLGILACVTCDDLVYQYSGYLMGLIYLTNAVNDLSPELLQEIMRTTFTPELHRDWQENYNYWQELKSPAREAANQAMDQVYDGFLKGNGQTLGLMSYSACVDLLVNFFSA